LQWCGWIILNLTIRDKLVPSHNGSEAVSKKLNLSFPKYNLQFFCKKSEWVFTLNDARVVAKIMEKTSNLLKRRTKIKRTKTPTTFLSR
jgi:hypothetical protein